MGNLLSQPPAATLTPRQKRKVIARWVSFGLAVLCLLLGAAFLYRGLTFVPRPDATDFHAQFEKALAESFLSTGTNAMVASLAFGIFGWFIGRGVFQHRNISSERT